MAQQGDRYVVELKEPHLQWGEYRYTDTRETVVITKASYCCANLRIYSNSA